MIVKKIFFSLVATIFIVSCTKSSGNKDNQEKEKEVAKVEAKKVDASLYGDALSSSSIAEPINLIPAISSDSASHQVAGYVYNGLVKYDKDLKLTGDLAESWEISKDNLSITFHLKKGVKWHDGEDFTAEDVKFTYEFMIADDTPTSYDGDFRKVKEFEIIDDYTVKVTYEEPYSPALNSWGMWIMPSHLLKGVSPSKSSLQRSPIGTGPYVFEEWQTGKSVTLKAFDDYFEGKPKIEKVILRIIPDQATQFMELLSGSIDIMGLNPMQAAKQTSNPRYQEQYNTYSYLDNAYTYVGYNLKKEPFDNILVRKALSYATPKHEIVNGIIFGKGVVATGPYKPGTYWYNENVEKYQYNLAKAQELLSKAGYIDSNNDGILEKDGKDLEFDLITNQGNTTRSQIAEVLQRSWSQIGVKVNIRILEWATFINEYINKGNFSAIVMGWNIVQDPDLFDVWSSTRCGNNGLNFICYENDEVDRLLEVGQKTYDLKSRKKAYDRIQEILAEEAPYTFLYVPDSNTALNKRFRNIKPAASGISYNFIDWYVPKVEQKYFFKSE